MEQPKRMDGEAHQKLKHAVNAMDKERQKWFAHWQQLSDYYLPRRYPYLVSASKDNKRSTSLINTKLLTSVSTIAVRTLASGMMNGVTSPARPWFRLRVAGFEEEALSYAVKVYLEETTRRILLILSESNFYNAMAVLYLEWCTFGTASMGIYEDFTDVVRFYNYAVGEFYISQDESGRVNRRARRFTMNLENLVSKFGVEAVKDSYKATYAQGTTLLSTEVEVHHLVEKNPKDGLVPDSAPFRELYWDPTDVDGHLLAAYPLYEWPGPDPRWELLTGSPYGIAPTMEALADVIELQHTLFERKQAIEKVVNPALLVDASLQNRPKALVANGLTYVPNLANNGGAREVHRANPPLQELAYDAQELTKRVQEALYNPLFNMISQLDTVRSANEIDGLREEKLVGLGPVLERFHNEGLSVILRRVFGIAERAGLLPERPEELDDLELQIQYVSVLSDAQRSVGTTSIERYLAFTGNLAGVYPDVTKLPDIEELMRDYAESVGIKATGLKSRERMAEEAAADAEREQLAQSAEIGNQLAQGAKTLSDTNVGGGTSALEAMLG